MHDTFFSVPYPLEQIQPPLHRIPSTPHHTGAYQNLNLTFGLGFRDKFSWSDEPPPNQPEERRARTIPQPSFPLPPFRPHENTNRTYRCRRVLVVCCCDGRCVWHITAVQHITRATSHHGRLPHFVRPSFFSFFVRARVPWSHLPHGAEPHLDVLRQIPQPVCVLLPPGGSRAKGGEGEGRIHTENQARRDCLSSLTVGGHAESRRASPSSQPSPCITTSTQVLID